ncbi:phosphoglycerate mutase [Colletotrichum cuscutae]|uniref:Phosphoglycerate mutase n=1 Tax=Colletotrichum cuscutae TaxID=1209917 RepID=A0AAI9Y2C0_9PEZI|nr:phosphoglycerate mutase [Colletotrichum cuscutae]
MKCFVVLLAATTLAMTAPADLEKSKNDDNFLHNCDFVNFGLGDNDQNPWIHYSCPLNKPPYMQCSRLELNDCIINDHGVLRGKEKGGFAKSCKDCVYLYEIGNLVCQCAFGNPTQFRETHRYLDQDVWLSGTTPPEHISRKALFGPLEKAAMGAVHLYLIRHGESVDNVANLYSALFVGVARVCSAGSRDAPLTNHGVLQAKRLGEHLATRTAAASAPVTHVFSSNLQRAHRTAMLAAHTGDADAQASSSTDAGSIPSTIGVAPLQLVELREKHFGTGEGQRFGARSSGERHEGAEDHDSMRVRAERFVDDYLAPLFACVEGERDEEQEGASNGTESIIIVAHGIILGVLARVLLAAGNFGSLATSTSDQQQRFSWNNTGYLLIHIKSMPAVDAKESAGLRSGTQEPRWPHLKLEIVEVNCTEHLRGLKKTRGGIGSAKFDEKQKTLSAFFKPTPSKRKHEDS